MDILLHLAPVTDYYSPITSAQDMHNHIQNSDMSDSSMSQLVCEEEQLSTDTSPHMKHVKEICDYCNKKIKVAQECEDNCLPWSKCKITEVGNYAQNKGVPHFGCEQFSSWCLHLWNG